MPVCLSVMPLIIIGFLVPNVFRQKIRANHTLTTTQPPSRRWTLCHIIIVEQCIIFTNAVFQINYNLCFWCNLLTFQFIIYYLQRSVVGGLQSDAVVIFGGCSKTSTTTEKMARGTRIHGRTDGRRALIDDFSSL